MEIMITHYSLLLKKKIVLLENSHVLIELGCYEATSEVLTYLWSLIICLRYVKWLITMMKPKKTKQPSKCNGGNHGCTFCTNKNSCVCKLFYNIKCAIMGIVL